MTREISPEMLLIEICFFVKYLSGFHFQVLTSLLFRNLKLRGVLIRTMKFIQKPKLEYRINARQDALNKISSLKNASFNIINNFNIFSVQIRILCIWPTLKK